MSLPLDELKKLVTARNLATGPKGKMVDAFLAHEAKVAEECRAYEVKIEEALVKKKEELETKTATELKEACASKGLKVGVGKADRVEILLQDARHKGEVDQVPEKMNFAARREELLSAEKAALRQLCEETGCDPCVKEVMVERILSHESETGAAVDDEAPPAKKARKSAK